MGSRVRSAVAAIAFVVAAVATVGAAQAQTAAILIPGAGGPVPSDFLIRNQGAFGSAGIEAIVATSPQEAAGLARQLKAANRRVFLVGMSRGGMMAAGALASGARVDGVVFISAGLGQIRQRLGSPARLPSALVVHHRNDGCALTSPEEVPGFVAWSQGRAQAAWIDTVGGEPPNPCGPRGAHGFYMQDSAPMRAILSFVR